MYSRFCGGFKDVMNILEPNSAVAKVYQNLAPHADAIFRNVLNGSQEKCIIHGDLWPCNILVHSDDRKSIKVIDFQMLGYADSTYDLPPFILSSLSLESLQSEFVLQAARDYFVFRSNAGIKFVHERREEFLQFFRTYSLSYGLIWFVISCRPLATSVDYIPKLIRVFELLYEMNVLEFISSIV